MSININANGNKGAITSLMSKLICTWSFYFLGSISRFFWSILGCH